MDFKLRLVVVRLTRDGKKPPPLPRETEDDDLYLTSYLLLPHNTSDEMLVERIEALSKEKAAVGETGNIHLCVNLGDDPLPDALKYLDEQDLVLCS